MIGDNPFFSIISPFFKIANRFIDFGVMHGAVLVHCASGISRSATLCCSYLMWKSGLSLSSALEQVRKNRGFVAPNAGFMQQLGDFEKYLKKQAKKNHRGLVSDYSDKVLPNLQDNSH